MINFQDVTFCYPNSKPILRNISFSINDKEIVSIVGKSGSGKTTMMNLMAGVCAPTSGSVALNENNMSYLMQDLTLLPYRTAYENCFLSCLLKGLDINKDLELKATNLLKLFDFQKDDFNKYPYELSGGMKQRIGLIQMLLADPSLLLLDEPFNAIDYNTIKIIENYIWQLFWGIEKKTLVLITHNLDQALSLSDRIIFLQAPSKINVMALPDCFKMLPPIERQKSEVFSELYYDAVKMISYEE